MSTSTSQDLRCPRCDAHARAGSQWCTLCYSDLRAGPTAPLSAGEPGAADPDVLDGPAGAPVPPAAPVARPAGKHARRSDGETTGGSPPASVAALPEAEIDRMIMELAAAQSRHPLGRVAPLVDSPGRKAALMVGGSVLAGTVVLLLMALAGALL